MASIELLTLVISCVTVIIALIVAWKTYKIKEEYSNLRLKLEAQGAKIPFKLEPLTKRLGEKNDIDFGLVNS